MAKMSGMWTDYGSKVLVDEKTCQSSPIESADPVLVSEFEQKICTFSKQLTILLQRRARGYDIEHDLFDHELARDEDVAILLWVAFAVAPKWMRISSARDAVGYFLWFCSRCGLYSPNGESHVGVWAEKEKSGSGVGSDFDCAWCCFRQDEVKQRGLVHHLDNKEDFYFNFTYGNSAISYGGDKAFDFFSPHCFSDEYEKSSAPKVHAFGVNFNPDTRNVDNCIVASHDICSHWARHYHDYDYRTMDHCSANCGVPVYNCSYYERDECMPPFEKDEDMILWLMGKGRQREIELREMRECAKRVEVKWLQEESLQRRKYWKGRFALRLCASMIRQDMI